MSIPHILLGLLTERPKHGYELKREHDERLPGAKPVAYGQVYSTLQRLERDGLVAVAETLSDGGPERTVYRLTDKGRERIRSWLSEVEPPAPYVTGALFTRLVLALIAGEDPQRYLDRQRAAHLARMRELTAVKTDPARTTARLLAADHALLHLDADLRWMELAARRLADLTKEIT
ncbi:PadR family transcriptional regulator [Thermomonospora catenispora]|uniref:PadR family transcriptional regulator n=1 Tax=Thermomonospora catenispora TaxID=2493090 RepID=UPI0011203A07|nr:PadR family transcriptional regulator [Thermomonospora catenispora]TNY38700.1 PadR family transcriptional regulator [Thermomonospora catenispora]